MKISELIDKLKDLKKEEGDIEIWVMEKSRTHLNGNIYRAPYLMKMFAKEESALSMKSTLVSKWIL